MSGEFKIHTCMDMWHKSSRSISFLSPLLGIGVVPETLREDNYDSWKRCLQYYLVGHGLWGVVTGEDTRPNEHDTKTQHDERMKKVALALHAIQLSCGAHISAQTAWAHLAQESLPPLPPSPTPHSSRSVSQTNGDGGYLEYVDLYKAIEHGNWKETHDFITKNPEAVNARVTSHNDTALHIAILSGHLKIAEHLVGKMKEADFKLTNKYGATALSLAAVCGNEKLAKMIVQKNGKLLEISNDDEDGQLPVIVAALYGQKRMVRYLYHKTPMSLLTPENDNDNGVKLLNALITADIYDVASELLKSCPKLGVIPDPSGHYALGILAQKPSAFPSGTKLPFWENLIYYFVTIHSPWDSQHDSCQSTTDIESSRGDHIHQTKGKVKNLLREIGWRILQCIIPKIKFIHDKKLVHDEAKKLLHCMFKEIRDLSKSELDKMDINKIIYDATKHGIIEFVSEMLAYKPDIIWKKDKLGRTIFAHAIALRQEKIFSLIYRLGATMNIMARRHDIFRNNYLHLAAKISPPTQLERVSGSALQMQRELQWFKEVESIVQPRRKEEVNENNMTPEAMFSEEHKQLMKDAESWMKNTAGSSMIVGTLIAAVMFTTAFTVPGGNRNDSGLPTMLESNPRPFMVFMVSNALSMFSSCTSLLMFLGILTARYAEEDFLKSLPTKLIFGLTCLFFSIVTMMASFGSALFLILHDEISWVSIPIIILSVIPIALFSICQFPLLIEMTNRTYGSGIFDKPNKKLFIWKRFCRWN